MTEHILAIEMKKKQILMNKPVYLELSILELGKTLMYEFWYDYVKPKYSELANSFIIHRDTNDIYKDIREDVETWFNTSNYELDRPLPKGENEKVIGLFKGKLGRKIMKKIVKLRAKYYSYLMDDGSEDKKAKGKKSVS